MKDPVPDIDIAAYLYGGIVGSRRWLWQVCIYLSTRSSRFSGLYEVVLDTKGEFSGNN